MNVRPSAGGDRRATEGDPMRAGAWGSRLDPSARDGTSTKMGIDATMPLGAAPMDFGRIQIPGEESVNLEEYRSRFVRVAGIPGRLPGI